MRKHTPAQRRMINFGMSPDTMLKPELRDIKYRASRKHVYSNSTSSRNLLEDRQLARELGLDLSDLKSLKES
jgi:hypothetical protein